MGKGLTRNVPDETVESYEEKSRLKEHSREQELRELPEAHKPLTPQERIAMSRLFRSRSPSVQTSLSLDDIREGLE